MASSLWNERYKMLFKLSIVVAILSTIKTGSATDLLDLPLSISSKSVTIHATLTDANGANKYFIQELISASGSSIKGKIVISGEKDSYNVYYNTGSGYKARLVIHGTNCLAITQQNRDQTLPGLDKPLTNLILLLGPSILYRLDHSFVWKSVENKNIRGIMMKGATTEINNRLKITYYYKKHLDYDDSGIKSPSRIEFSGYDPSSTSSSSKENLILDIYLQNENYHDDLANEVQSLPGIGCPLYLLSGVISISAPRLDANYLHYIMYESIQGSTNTRTYSEVHASKKTNLLRLKTTLLGVTTEAIYDYNLGVSYLFQEGGTCGILSADLNSPGISSYGYFDLNALFLLDSSLEYLGKLNLERRSGFPVDVWETVRYNVTINGKKVDKAVITQYFAESPKNEIFYDHTLVSTTITVYKLDPSNKTYTLTDKIIRDYMNFETAGLEDELNDIFSLKGCKYLSSDKSLTLALKLSSDAWKYSPTYLESHIYMTKRSFLNFNIYSKAISPLRIDAVEFTFNGTQIEITITFLDSPNLQYIFNLKSMSVNADTFKKMRTIKADNEYECLEKLSKYQDTIMVVIYRPSYSSCGYLTNLDDFKEDTKTGEPCSVYHFPLHNLHRIDQELPLDRIHDTFLQDVGTAYSLLDAGYTIRPYKLIDVIDVTKKQATSAGAFQSIVRRGAKLNSKDQDTLSVPDVKTFADCYRTCHNSEQLKCNTFSFCEHGECRVSSLATRDSYNESHIEQDKTCSIYALEVLNDYIEVRQRRFKTQTSIAVNEDINYCAQSCHTSPDCFSFQWSHYRCSFGGFYTDADTEYDEECSIYIPKVYEKYQKTGNIIVSDGIHTEMNLNFEQCAALCHGWSDGDTGCKSFNYCPKSKTESSCTLTAFSVKSPNTKTIEGGVCSNYELKVGSNGKKIKESSSTEVTKGTSGSGAFGIIMLFLFVGALLGLAAPFGYTKVKQMRNVSTVNESFTWTRQENEQAENIN